MSTYKETNFICMECGDIYPRDLRARVGNSIIQPSTCIFCYNVDNKEY